MELKMTLNECKSLNVIVSTTSEEKDDEFSIPLDISDIISICKDFNSLGWQIQNQVENILEVGVEESIKSGNVKKESLPHIKHFLRKICDNAYFGDAVSQAEDCISLIKDYEERYQIRTASNYN
jgi:hypothetical protein